MKEIATFYDGVEAEVALSFLTSRGFDVSIANHHQKHAGLPNGDLAFRLMASDEEAWLAKETLATQRREPSDGHCPRCGSGRKILAPDWQFPLSLWEPVARLLGYVPAPGHIRCGRCAHTWKDTDDES
ncbi:MAG: hypothetical protein AAFX52_01500 [Pseudomonadota bacterium]